MFRICYHNKFTALITGFCSLLFYSSVVAQSSIAFDDQAFKMLKLLERNNYSERSIDQKLSESSWNNLFNYLDPYHVIFMEKDINVFKSYQSNMAELAINKQGHFLEEITKLYKIRLEEADSLINVICSKPFKLNENDTIIFYKENSIVYPVSRKIQYERWRKIIKHRAIIFLVTPDKKYSKACIDSMLLAEPVIREKTKKYEKRIIKRILNHPAGYESFVASIYMNSFATCFDPHTMYFTPNDKQNFEDQVSSETYSFGFYVEESPEMEIKIADLVPGSSAWNSNLLHKGDVLLEIRWPNKKTFAITVASVEEVYQILKESDNDKLTLVVRKANGTNQEVILVKTKIKAEENLVKGVILKGEKKVGYISLPGFYTEWDDPGMPGCANDVAKEILKLQADSIEGLILDVRSNGGGSMTEALNLAGIFIDEGPLCLYKLRGQKAITMKDANRGTVYNGPLIVMVNALSASASELISATLQDYNRALVVGNPTFGKSTGQIILPNDTSVDITINKVPQNRNEMGYVKTTTFKFYRITGDSHQIEGVIPDISLPDIYRENDVREVHYKSALPNDSIVKKVYYTPWPKLPVSTLSENSNKRCKSNSELNFITSTLDSLEMYYNKDTVILNIASYVKIKDKINRLIDKLEKANDYENTSFHVFNNRQNNEIYQIDDYSRELNEQFIKSIKSDLLLEETYNIMSDWIQMYKKK